VGEGPKKPNRNAVVNIDYKLYFFDHTPIEEGTEVKLSLGDITWPEGLWKGIEHMRKGESAKIRIKKKKYGFGRKEQQDKLRVPKGFERPEAPDTEEGKA
jgi:FKBP-type peptidyl-prolyl cis-trans isomerase 2